jgi:DNA-binding NarL/FixJ family response regulator
LAAAGFEVVGVATTAEEAVEIARAERPDIVLMDIRLAGVRDGSTLRRRSAAPRHPEPVRDGALGCGHPGPG